MLLIGSLRPLVLDGPKVAARYARPDTAAALTEVGIESPAALLATWITDRRGLESYAGDAAPVTDDRPAIEHAAWVRRGEFERVLPRVLSVATEVPLASGDPLRDAVEAERRELLDFYRFALHVNAREPELASSLLRTVLGRDPANPYYLWMIGKG